MGAPLTWLGLGRLSGLNIRDCRTWEDSSQRHQINVKYRIWPMRFPVPREPIWLGLYYPGDVPMFADFKVKDFPEQEVEIIVSTEFRYHVDAEQERLMAGTIFQLWSNQSGHANWQRELRMAEYDRVRNR